MLSHICKFATSLSICEDRTAFQLHLDTFGISYGTNDEYEFRYQIFKQTDKFIKEQNSLNSSFTLAHNYMSTWTEDERAAKLTGVSASTKGIERPLLSANPTAIDWRTKGVVGPVHNQGASAGEIYPFADAMTSAWAIKTGKLVELSSQQLLDCVDTHFMSNYWKYIETVGL
jgi:KDEL-tailed cysteine endopeptidase